MLKEQYERTSLCTHILFFFFISITFNNNNNLKFALLERDDALNNSPAKFVYRSK